MSSEKESENLSGRKFKVSWGRFVRPGLAGPKVRPKGVADGQTVEIPLPVGSDKDMMMSIVTGKVGPSG